MKALVLAPMTAEALASLRELLPVTYESWADTQRLADPEELARRIEREGFWILVVEADFLPEELFQQAPTLRLVAVCRNSVANVNLAAATSHGVAVVNTPGRNAPAVAELTIGLMLALARRITSLDVYVKAGRWQSPVEPYLAMHRCDGELAGKTLGIIGLGKIGCRVAGLARAFDMRVLAFDPYLAAGTPADTAGLSGQARPVHAQVDTPTFIEAGDGSFMSEPAPMPSGSLPVELMPGLPELVGRADYISVHVPDTPDTQGLLNREVLAEVKPGCRIINTSSYYAVDEEALVEALQAGRVAGAAFDVFQTHPIPPNSPLLRLDPDGIGVVLTPHVGGATQETVVRHSKMVLEDIARFIQDRRPEHLVNPEVWDRRG